MTRPARRVTAMVAAGVVFVLALGLPTSASVSSSLTRLPYLTDLVKRRVTVNWATSTAVSTGSVTYGRQGVESCHAHEVRATSTKIIVGSIAEKQWKADLAGLRSGIYCYSVLGDATDLLAPGPWPTFRRQVRPRASTPFSFAVFGDWGKVDMHGNNDDQALLLAQVAASAARFAVTTGDTAYPDGSQLNYGDLDQSGNNTSAIFGPSFWPVAGGSIPLFNAQGNHGLNTVPLINWPQAHAVASSRGRYEMQTYCCVNGTGSANYPSSWYAFNAGQARFYVLEAAWKNGNVGSADLYQNDYDAHWTVDSDEYRWLANDLAKHPKQVSFAFFHFPLYSSNAAEESDPWLSGPTHLEGLLANSGVDVVFNGHAHIYARNVPSAPGMPVTYVTGGGGGTLQPTNSCASVAAYAIGWNPGSACGAAAPPTTVDSVYHFLLVTVDGTQVTVTPTDELGRTFDVQTYDFS
jgi:hypothetical protein